MQYGGQKGFGQNSNQGQNNFNPNMNNGQNPYAKQWYSCKFYSINLFKFYWLFCE
jgi:hypothetical protein